MQSNEQFRTQRSERLRQKRREYRLRRRLRKQNAVNLKNKPIVSQIVRLTKKKRGEETANTATRGSKYGMPYGIYYEMQIHNIMRKCEISGRAFNTQNREDITTCAYDNDLQCNYQRIGDIGIEIKTGYTPSWISSALNREKYTWDITSQSEHRSATKWYFRELIREERIEHDSIDRIRYIPAENNTINRLFLSRKCHYIQIKDFGLYHLGQDICGFGTPKLDMKCLVKVDNFTRRDGSKKVAIACCPMYGNLRIEPSPYSLDDITRLPPKLRYVETA